MKAVMLLAIALSLVGCQASATIKASPSAAQTPPQSTGTASEPSAPVTPEPEPTPSAEPTIPTYPLGEWVTITSDGEDYLNVRVSKFKQVAK